MSDGSFKRNIPSHYSPASYRLVNAFNTCPHIYVYIYKYKNKNFNILKRINEKKKKKSKRIKFDNEIIDKSF